MSETRVFALPLVLLAIVASSCTGVSDPANVPPTGLSGPVRIEELPGAATMNRLFWECMREKGWQVTLEEGAAGYVTFEDVAEDQESLQTEDDLACTEEINRSGVLPDPRRPPSEELVRLWFDAQVAIAGCLADRGYPTPDIPSWTTYYAVALGGGPQTSAEGGRWDPMSLVREAARAGDEKMRENATVDCLEDEESGQ